MAIGDIRNFSDSIPWSGAPKALLKRGVPGPLAVAALRVHVEPELFLSVKNMLSKGIKRMRGLLTGTHSATFIACLLVEEAVLAVLPELKKLGCPFGDVDFGIMA